MAAGAAKASVMANCTRSTDPTPAVRFAAWILPARRKDWAEAMFNEIAYIKSRRVVWIWVLECTLFAVRERASFELERTFMTPNNLIMRNAVFAWIALGTCLLLLVPFGAMQFTSAVRWGAMDFIVMGFLLFGAGTVFVLTARKVPQKYRPALGAVVAAAFVCVWAELAVGIFTNLGS